jgi:hypothetical protein
LGADGVCLFSPSHQASGEYGVTQSNYVAADISESALEAACIAIEGWKDANGMQKYFYPQSLHVPTASWFIANRILRSVLQPGTANNDVNALKMLGKFPKGIFQHRFFTDTDAWFIKTNVDMNGMVHFLRKDSGAPQLENEFDTECAKFKISIREVFTWFDWRTMFGSEGV